MGNTECDVKKCMEYDKRLMYEHSNIKREVVGYSTLGHEIIAYTVGSINGVLCCGAFHGMERVTAQILYKFLEDVCVQCKKNTRLFRLLRNSGITVIPMINPDGVEISLHGASVAGKNKKKVNECIRKSNTNHTRWQANANGVDINHNFDADFEGVKTQERAMGINSPALTRYGGEYPESERETKALCDFCRKNRYRLAVALHTQGREIYYDFKENTPKQSKSIANALAKLSGYTVSHPQGIAVGGGFKDWFIDYFHRPAFTIEVGLGVNPLSPDIIDTEYGKVAKMLWYLLKCTTKPRQ